MDSILNFEFDRGKPFYPLIMSYIVQIHGFIELISRGTILSIRLLPGDFDDNDPKLDATLKAKLSAMRLSGLTELLGQLTITSRMSNEITIIDVNKLSLELSQDGLYILPQHVRNTAGILLLAAWEITEPYHDANSPLWEFLRHCRNAAAHGGNFNLLYGEPRHPAQWGKLIISPSLNGTPLFDPTPTTQGFLSPGDAVKLLSDIEQANPNMTV